MVKVHQTDWKDTAMTASPAPRPANPGLSPQMLNHVAWVTHDIEGTVDFYARIMGMPLASTVFDDKVPSTGDDFPYFHIFFRMQDGSTIAFFDAPGVPARAAPTHPAYSVFDHIALQAADKDEVDRWADWIRKNGIDVVGPTDHKGLIYSIYFHDPNGYRVEITAPVASNWNRAEQQAQKDLAMWVTGMKQAKDEGKDPVGFMVDMIREERKRYGDR